MRLNTGTVAMASPRMRVTASAQDHDSLFLAVQNYFGAEHAFALARAPSTGGALVDFWHPGFLVQNLVSGPRHLFTFDGVEWRRVLGDRQADG